MLDEGTPLAAEVWASQLLNLFDSNRTEARLAGMDVPPFEEALLNRALARHDRRSRLVAAALAAVLPPPLDDRARTVAEQLASPQDPAWLADIGAAHVSEAWVASDVFGDEEAVILRFEERGGRSHALVTLVDHNLDGQAKDVWLSDDPAGVVAMWSASDDPHMHTAPLPAENALALVAAAMDASELWNGDGALRTEDFARHRALALARLRRAGHRLTDRPPEPIRPSTEERQTIVRQFLVSPAGRAVAGSHGKEDVRQVAERIIDLRSDYEGRPLRWSPIVVEIVMADLAPRKLLLDADLATALPDVIRAFVRFAASRTGLGTPFVEEIVEAVAAHEKDYLQRMADPSAAGPAKAVLSALVARGVRLHDQEACQEALATLRTSPRPWAPERGPKAEAPPDVVECASRSVVLARFDALVAFYAESRKVTANGNVTLADARQLVALLGTSDRLDPVHGNKVFKTRSASELPELDFTVRWALAAGALRRQGAKLRATATWASLAGQPLERWRRAAGALTVLGPLQGWFARAMPAFKTVLAFVDDLIPDMLEELSDQPLAFGGLLDDLCADMEDALQWSGYWKDPEMRRETFRRDLDALLRILGWAGVATRRSTGLVELTAAGRWWLAEA